MQKSDIHITKALIRNFCCAKYDTHFLLAGWCGALVVFTTRCVVLVGAGAQLPVDLGLVRRHCIFGS